LSWAPSCASSLSCGAGAADLPVLVDAHELPVGQPGAVLPIGPHTLVQRAAEDRVHRDALGGGCLAGRPVVDVALGKGLVAGDEDALDVLVRRAPREVPSGAVDHAAAELAAAVRLQREECFRHLVQVSGERHDESDKAFLRGQPVIAVLVESDFQLRHLAAQPERRELADDLPQLRPGLIDQAVHAVRRIQEQCHLDLGRRLRRLVRGPTRHDQPAH